jgi:cytoskeletal protein CcmA (bactofilin family)
MTRIYEYDHIDGLPRPPLVVQADASLLDTHIGTVHVETGTLYIRGTLEGTLDVQPQARAVISGGQLGTVMIAGEALISVSGTLQGTTALEQGAVLIVEATGKCGGTLANDGLVIVRGLFAGKQTGDGELRFEENGQRQEPVERDGQHVYDWVA